MNLQYAFELAAGAWAEWRKVKLDNLFDFSYLHLSLFFQEK